jgi:HNH endonuclease
MTGNQLERFARAHRQVGGADDAAAVRTSSDLADGLAAIAESFLAGKVASADDPEIYQVVVHAGTDVLGGPAAPAGRRTDLHHIQHWVNGGRTDLANLVSLCPYHHKAVHDRGYLIAAPAQEDAEAGGGFAFYRPDGTPLPASPPLPPPDGTIGGTHDADITPETTIPQW